MNGLDYSAGTIPGKVILSSGYQFVIRYVEDPNSGRLNSKHITPQEYKDLTSAGVTVWLVYEISTTDMDGGFSAGQAHARSARAGANWIGYPADQVIFFACDKHETAAQIPIALAYLDGAADILGRGIVGVYGFVELINAAIAQGKAPYRWQCGVAPAANAQVHVWQDNTTSTSVNGIGCDINRLLRPIGAAAPAAPAAPAAAVPLTQPATATNPNADEDVTVNLVPGTDRHVVIPAAGRPPYLYIGLGFGDSVDVHQIVFVGPTPANSTGGNYLPGGFTEKDAASAWKFTADRPGPVKIPDGCAMVVIRYTTAAESAVAYIG